VRHPSIGIRATATAVLGAVAVATGLAAPVSAQPSYDSYVALGDSFVAGPGIPPASSGEDCGRSQSNYPHLVAEALGVREFTDVSCSGAVSADLAGQQVTPLTRTAVPPQYDALRPDTDLVTVGIGGNDVGLVALAVSCINVAPPPNGTSCSDTDAAGPDPITTTIDAFAPVYREITEEIRTRSPRARILFVGYPTGIRDGGCFPEQRIWPQDATYLESAIEHLDVAMEKQVSAAGAEFVDLRASTVGHDACAAPDQRWMEGVVPTSPAIPLHPNAAGHRNAADQVLGAVRRAPSS